MKGICVYNYKATLYKLLQSFGSRRVHTLAIFRADYKKGRGCLSVCEGFLSAQKKFFRADYLSRAGGVCVSAYKEFFILHFLRHFLS